MKRVLFVISTLLLGLYFFGGSCDRLNYDYRQNQAPKVYFVNIPTEDSKFSSDTTIYWYGTDVDGFIDMYRYAVVPESDVGGDVVTYLQSTDAETYPWDTVDVTRDDPGTGDEIKLSANISDPVREYRKSYIFLQAIDNLGMKSDIIYRSFQKNSHYPNTYISAQDVTDPYVNAFTDLSGVTIGWRGVDSADWGGDPPAFDFKWKLYGPYTDAEMAEINDNYTGEIFLDKFGDIYFDDDTYPIDDTNRVPVLQVDRVHGSWEDIIFLDTIVDTMPPRLRTFYPIPESMLRIVDSSGMDLSDIYTYRDWTSEWTTETEQILYNVFYNSPFSHDTTSEYNFLLWCESRDDSRVIDAVPDFQWISVIDPKFEREVIVLDFTRYPWGGTPKPNVAKPYNIRTQLGNMINDYGNTVLGKDNIFDFEIIPERTVYKQDGTSCNIIQYNYYQITQDYYPVTMVRTFSSSCLGASDELVSLREILKHKVIIIVKDGIEGALALGGGAANPSGYPELVSVIDGLNAGMSCWSMARDAYADPKPFSPSFCTGLSDAYRSYFGVLRIYCEAWYSQIKSEDIGDYSQSKRNENFIGADVISEFQGAFPNLTIDTNAIEDYYYWSDPFFPSLLYYPFRWSYCNDNYGDIIVGAFPGVGYVEKSPSTLVQPVYLYKSCYRPPNDTSSDYAGLQEVGTYTEVDISGCPTGGTNTLLIGSDIAYKGRVVALYTDAYYFRTSHFSFTLLPFDSTQAKQTFKTMMDSLYASPFLGQTGKVAAPRSASMKPYPGIDVSEFRRITKELHDAKNEEIRKAREGILE